jgi:NAD(P)-dependent dehydrogenase (short-subunit alcohol dehydrogenase family)
MIQLTRSLAFDLAAYQINVNCICPAYIPTAISPNFPHTPVGKHTLSHLPRSRPGLPEDLDGALLLLASGRPSRLLTGVVLPVDDGYSVI